MSGINPNLYGNSTNGYAQQQAGMFNPGGAQTAFMPQSGSSQFGQQSSYDPSQFSSSQLSGQQGGFSSPSFPVQQTGLGSLQVSPSQSQFSSPQTGLDPSQFSGLQLSGQQGGFSSSQFPAQQTGLGSLQVSPSQSQFSSPQTGLDPSQFSSSQFSSPQLSSSQFSPSQFSGQQSPLAAPDLNATSASIDSPSTLPSTGVPGDPASSQAQSSGSGPNWFGIGLAGLAVAGLVYAGVKLFTRSGSAAAAAAKGVDKEMVSAANLSARAAERTGKDPAVRNILANAGQLRNDSDLQHLGKVMQAATARNGSNAKLLSDAMKLSEDQRNTLAYMLNRNNLFSSLTASRRLTPGGQDALLNLLKGMEGSHSGVPAKLYQLFGENKDDIKPLAKFLGQPDYKNVNRFHLWPVSTETTDLYNSLTPTQKDLLKSLSPRQTESLRNTLQSVNYQTIGLMREAYAPAVQDTERRALGKALEASRNGGNVRAVYTGISKRDPAFQRWMPELLSATTGRAAGNGANRVPINPAMIQDMLNQRGPSQAFLHDLWTHKNPAVQKAVLVNYRRP